MNILFTLFLFSSSVFAIPKAQKGYEEPPHACYQGCTPWMQDLLSKFEDKGTSLMLVPAVYSGKCFHLSEGHHANQEQYAVVMIDENQAKTDFYFSTIFSFYAGYNEFETWDLATSRTEMSPYWKEHGKMLRSEKTTRIEIPYDSGDIAYSYYLRQNPVTKDLYYITYAGIYTISFCELKQNPPL